MDFKEKITLKLKVDKWESIEQIDQVIKDILRIETCLQKTERWKTMTCLKSTSQYIWLERLNQSIGSRSRWTKKQRTLSLLILGWKDGHILLSQYSFQASQAEKQKVSVLRKFPGPGNEALPVKVTFDILVTSVRCSLAIKQLSGASWQSHLGSSVAVEVFLFFGQAPYPPLCTPEALPLGWCFIHISHLWPLNCLCSPSCSAFLDVSFFLHGLIIALN